MCYLWDCWLTIFNGWLTLMQSIRCCSVRHKNSKIRPIHLCVWTSRRQAAHRLVRSRGDSCSADLFNGRRRRQDNGNWDLADPMAEEGPKRSSLWALYDETWALSHCFVETATQRYILALKRNLSVFVYWQIEWRILLAPRFMCSQASENSSRGE